MYKRQEQGHIVRRRFARDLIGVSHAVEVTVHIEQAPTVLETRRFGARVRGGHFDAWGFRVNRSLVPLSLIHICCCVEDSLPGIAAGRAAGLTVIAKREERFGFTQDAADAIIDSIPDVLDL